MHKIRFIGRAPKPKYMIKEKDIYILYITKDMETFAEYILNEKEISAKLEITYYLAKKRNIFFDKSVVFKTEIARIFLNYIPIEIDKNLILTACLLCNCQKLEISQDLEQIKSYAKRGAEYLFSIGFDKRFCKICEEVNRYSNSNPREKESDILELVDQFGGMLLDRPERIGLKPDEALVLLEYRNLKDKYNRYMQSFIDFIKELEKMQYDIAKAEVTPLEALVELYRNSEDEKKFITAVVYEFEPQIDELLEKKGGIQYAQNKKILAKENPNRPLFSEETTRKVMGHLLGNEEE